MSDRSQSEAESASVTDTLSVSFTLDWHGHLFEDADETLAGRLEAVYVDRHSS